MLKRLGSACVIGVATVLLGAAPATQPQLSPADVALVRQLGSGSWKDRKSAEQALLKQDDLDETKIRAMRSVADNDEARTRLDEILAQLRQRQAFGPTPISLHVKSASAKDVYPAVFAQAGLPMSAEPAGLLEDASLRRLTLDADRASFWTVMQRLGAQSGLNLMPAGSGKFRLARTGVTAAPGAWVASGPFLIAANRVEYVHDMWPDRRPRNTWFDIIFDVDSEPNSPWF